MIPMHPRITSDIIALLLKNTGAKEPIMAATRENTALMLKLVFLPMDIQKRCLLRVMNLWARKKGR